MVGSTFNILVSNKTVTNFREENRIELDETSGRIGEERERERGKTVLMVERSKNLGGREGLVMKRRRFLRGTMRREGIFLQGGYSIFRGFHDSLFERGESVTFSRALSK